MRVEYVFNVPGGRVTIDHADLDLFLSRRWSVSPSRKDLTAGKPTVYFHREIFGSAADGFVVDHINHNPLDNRRSNLRLATIQQNSQNRAGANKNSKTGVRGVVKSNGRFQAFGYAEGRTVYIGTYDTAPKASDAANQWRAVYYEGGFTKQ